MLGAELKKRKLDLVIAVPALLVASPLVCVIAIAIRLTMGKGRTGGASILVGNDIGQIRSVYREMLAAGRMLSRPELWDGRTAPRIVAALVAEHLGDGC